MKKKSIQKAALTEARREGRGFGLVSPALIIIIIFTIYPICFLIYWSFFSGSLVAAHPKFVALKNYKSLLVNPDFGKIVVNTAIYSFVLVFLQITLSLLLAAWLNGKLNKRLSSTVQAVAFMPHIISFVSVSMVFMWLMNKDVGFFNSILTKLGLQKCMFMAGEKTALGSIIFVMLWKSLGYYTLLMIAAMQGVPKEVYEAAELDEAPAWRVFTRITVPFITPTVFFTIITATINSFKVFDIINLMTQGGPMNSTNTLVYYIYEMSFKFGKPGVGSAAGVLLLILVGALTILYFRVMEKRVHYQ